MQRVVSLFPVWAITLSLFALKYPQFFVAYKETIIPLLALVMFCMGMTLTWVEFRAVFKRPAVIVVAIAIQFIGMPFFAWIISRMLNLQAEVLIGMVLVGASAGGTASNVICYLAKGNVALSILMTVVSTLCAVFLMPLLTFLYLNQTVDVPVWNMLQSILLMVLIPVLSGTLINSFFRQRLHKIQSVFPLLSSLAIIFIIAIIIGLNQKNLADIAVSVLLAVCLHNALGLMAGYWLTRLLKYDARTARTVSIEVGMQNSGLSVALAIKYFSTMAALPGAVFSIWHNLSGGLLAFYWRQAGKASKTSMRQ